MSTSSAVPALNLAVKVSDLTNTSHLKNLVQNNAKPVFQFATEIAPFWNSSIQNVPNGTSAGISLSGSADWKTKDTGIGFSLSGSAQCKLEVILSGALIKYAPDLDSQATAELPGTDYSGFAYLKLSLDFQISGNVSGSGSIGPVGISGNAKGSSEASIIFCHRVAGTMALGTAVQETFEKFVFPFQPSCAVDMATEDIAQANFNGTLAAGVTVNYGIPAVSFAAPGVESVLDSAATGVAQFKLPSGKIDIGASAGLNYTHSDDFSAIVHKTSDTAAFLYIMRTMKDTTGATLGVNAKVTITGSSGITPDSQKIQQAVNSITGGIGGDKVAAEAGNLAQKLNDKLNNWINNTVSKGASLGAVWDRQKSTSMLFKYVADLTQAKRSSLLESWRELCNGDLLAAGKSGGLVAEAGSGIESQLDRSFTISLQFFNLFAFSQKTDFFNKASMTITDNGEIRFVYNVGTEGDTTINKKLDTCKIFFLASVNQRQSGNLAGLVVDLHLELSANNDATAAGRIGDVVGFIRPNQQVNTAQKAMQQFVADNKSGKLTLSCILKPSAYGRFSCSEFTGKKHDQPPTSQQQDSENWIAFHDASLILLRLDFVSDLSYLDWQQFNVLCNDGSNGQGTPNRRHPGNEALATDNYWSGKHVTAPAALVNYFCLNSAEFMNLCDDLHALAGLAGSVDTLTQWNALRASLINIIQQDVDQNYATPCIAALLKLCNPESVTYDGTAGSNSFAANLILT